MSWIVFVLALATVGALFAAAHQSRSRAPDYGLDEGRLRGCPATPNCVCSEAGGADPARAIDPLPLAGREHAAAWQALQDAIASLGGDVVLSTGDSLAATFRTPLLGFIDDLEARLDRDAGVIQLRSASRVGHSDLGANRKRIERLVALFTRAPEGR
jgi:uncharacterized protein (DUF1499 family)